MGITEDRHWAETVTFAVYSVVYVKKKNKDNMTFKNNEGRSNAHWRVK